MLLRIEGAYGQARHRVEEEEVNATFKKDVHAHQQHSQAFGTANMDSETQNTANLCDRLLE